MISCGEHKGGTGCERGRECIKGVVIISFCPSNDRFSFESSGLSFMCCMQGSILVQKEVAVSCDKFLRDCKRGPARIRTGVNGRLRIKIHCDDHYTTEPKRMSVWMLYVYKTLSIKFFGISTFTYMAISTMSFQSWSYL